MSDRPRAREWGVLLKARLAEEATPADPDQLDRLLAQLPGADKRLTGGGRDVTVAFWIEAADAAHATRRAAETARRAAAATGLGELRFIRTHAASVEGRAPAFPMDDARLGAAGAWAVDLRVALAEPDRPATRELLDHVSAALAPLTTSVTFHGDLEKFLLDDGSGFSVRCWAVGETLDGALGPVRAALLTALHEAGHADASLVRVKAWDPRALHADTFPGATSRTPQPNGELR